MGRQPCIWDGKEIKNKHQVGNRDNLSPTFPSQTDIYK